MSESDDERPRTNNIIDPSQSVRTLRFNLSEWPDWVGTLDDNELFKIFKIGVAVRDSISMKITSGEELFGEVLSQVKDTKEILEEKIESLLTPLENCEKELMQLTSKPASKGAIGELVVDLLLTEGLPEHTIKKISTEKPGGMGDIHVTSPNDHKYLIEVKKRKNNVPASDIERFEENLRENKDFTAGILLSLDSGIARRATYRKFEIMHSDEQYFIYVPNARKEKHLIVWSVLLADELAALDEGLTDAQTEELLKLQQKFQANVEKVKKCRSRFDALERVVNDLKEDLMPLLQIVDGAKTDLNKALHLPGKRKSRKTPKSAPSQKSQKMEKFLTPRKTPTDVSTIDDEEKSS